MTPDPNDPDGLAARQRHDRLSDEFELAWKSARPRIEDYLPREPEAAQGALFRELLDVELAVRRQRGENPAEADYIKRFPQFAAVVAAAFEQTSAVVGPQSGGRAPGARFPVGTEIAGRYVIVAELGRGGMGEVYRAEDKTLNQPVALKFLHEGRTGDKDWVDQLTGEVVRARSVSHGNVCRVHDIGVHHGQSFLTMEFIDGTALSSSLEQHGRFAQEKANDYARQLCAGLAAVHDAGFLHRDLKPGNVLLDNKAKDKDKKVKLADFGLAAEAEQVRPEEAERGTWQYMAPEQLHGNVPTVRSDLYALGAVLYELVTGRRPFVAKSRAELSDLQRTPPARPSDLVPGLDPLFDRAIMWCLERDPQNRPASARDVENALPPLSPEMTGTRGGTGTLSPRTAAALLGAALLGLLVHAVTADQTMAFRQLPPAKHPAALRERAAEVARSIGAGKETAEHVGFEWDLDLVKDVSRNRPKAWRPGPDARSPLVYFWYRSGPEHHAPSNRFAPTDPPLITPGMACVLLDLDGRLIEYHAVPARGRQPATARTRDASRDHWERTLLEASGLNPGGFRRSPPHHRPAVFAEDLWGMEEIDGTGKWVDVALCDDRPVYFRVCEPFPGRDRPDRAQGENVEAQGQRRLAGGFVTIGILLLTVTAAGPVAYRNWRLGRADTMGALRVVGVYVVVNLLTWLSLTDHVRSLHVERVLLMNSFGITAFWGVVLLVCYLAVEPHMRRRWPERLSAWNRLLAGKFRDPLVGRDVLVGIIAGALFALPLKLAAAGLGTYYLLAPVYDPLTPNAPSGLMFALVAVALIRTAGAFVLLLLLGLLFRREWPALTVMAVVMTAGVIQAQVAFDEKSWVTWVANGAVTALIIATVVRFGWLTTLVGLFVASVFNIMPLTFAPHAWYAGATLTAAGVLVALAVYGFFVSLGGQRLLSDNP